MEITYQFFSSLIVTFTSFESRLAIVYLLTTVLIVAALWIMRGRPTSFLAFLLPKDVYLHKSNLVDIKIFLFNAMLGATGLFAAVTMTPLMTSFVLDGLLHLTENSTVPADD